MIDDPEENAKKFVELQRESSDFYMCANCQDSFLSKYLSTDMLCMDCFKSGG